MRREIGSRPRNIEPQERSERSRGRLAVTTNLGSEKDEPQQGSEHLFASQGGSPFLRSVTIEVWVREERGAGKEFLPGPSRPLLLATRMKWVDQRQEV
jgi:hypothetical protein